MLTEYFPILLFLLVAGGIGIALLLIGAVLGPRSKNKEKSEAYECGFEAFEDARMQFDVRYYLIAILFILFDLEIAFLFPWAVVFKQIGLVALVGTLIGALLGAVIAHYLPAEWLNKMLPVVVFACGVYLLFGGTPKAPLDADAPVKKKWQFPQGFTLGFYDGVAGPGTGAFWTVSTLLLYPIDLVKASGVARSMNFVSNAAALSVFIFSGQVDWLVGLSMGSALMVGAFFGARTAISGGSKFIRPVFITVVLALTVRLAWQHWFGQA